MIKYCHFRKETFISDMLVDIYRNGKTRRRNEFWRRRGIVDGQFLFKSLYHGSFSFGKQAIASRCRPVTKKKNKKKKTVRSWALPDTPYLRLWFSLSLSLSHHQW